MQTHVKNEPTSTAKVRFVMYDRNVNGSRRVYSVFSDKVTAKVMMIYFPDSVDHIPIIGQIYNHEEFCRDRFTFEHIGVEPRQCGPNKNKRTRDDANDDGAPPHQRADESPHLQAVDDIAAQLAASKQEADTLKTQFIEFGGNIVSQLRHTFKERCGEIKKSEKPVTLQYMTLQSVTLQSIYTLLPPLRKDAKLVVEKNNRTSIADALKKAKLHYHPDKQGPDPVRQAICTEIAKLINHMQEVFDKKIA
jgi:hypothetical protein